MMNKLLVSVAAVAALTAAAAPALAQPRGDYRGYGQSENYGQNYNQNYGQNYRGQQARLTTGYVDGLDWKIANAAREGRISWGEARQLRQQVRQIHDMVWRVETRQAGQWEVNRVNQVVSRVEQAIGGWNQARGYDQRRRY